MRVRFLAAMLALGVTGCSASPRLPQTRDGVLDLSEFPLAGHSVRLTGEWQMFWRKLVSDDPRQPLPPPDFSTPLGVWNSLRLSGGEKLGSVGYASYRLVIRLPDSARDGRTPLMVRSCDADTAFRLVIRDQDGRVLGEVASGRVSTESAGSVPFDRPGAVRFTTTSDLVLTLFVSNHESAYGGPFGSMTVGFASDLEQELTRRLMIDFCVIGLLVMIALHHLVMFLLRPRERAPLWFAIICLVFVLRTLETERYLVALWPEPRAWALFLRIAYLTFYAAVGLFPVFLRELFPRHFDRRITRLILLVAVLFNLAVIVLPPSIFPATLGFYQAFAIAVVGWCAWGFVRAAFWRGDKLAQVTLGGALILAATAVWDVLLAQEVVVGSNLAHLGLAAFVFSQSVVLAVMNARARREAETSAREVQLLNESLQRQIGDRSQQLQKALLLVGAGEQVGQLVDGEILAERYSVERPIGTGGMGRVYRATRVADGRAVAVKVLQGTCKPKALARFAREAELVARIQHPNVIAIHDLDVTARGQFFIVMELVTGESLESARERYGDVDWALPILRQLASALVAIHEHGVVHRDLKPGNILVADGVVKVADFGIGGLREGGIDSIRSLVLEEQQTALKDLKLTQAGTFLGTPLYMAPELIGGVERASPRSDVFSFGLLAFELLTGRRPFDKAVVLERAEGRTPEMPPSLASLTSLNLSLAAVLDRCIHFAPAARPSSSELESVLSRS
jgi:hypothetical protein